MRLGMAANRDVAEVDREEPHEVHKEAMWALGAAFWKVAPRLRTSAGLQ